MSNCYQYNSYVNYDNYPQNNQGIYSNFNNTMPNQYLSTGTFNMSDSCGRVGRFTEGNSNRTGMGNMNLSRREGDLPKCLSNTLGLRKSPERKTLSKSMMQIEENCCEVLKILVDIETEAEKQKIENFVKSKDFNVFDVF